MCPRSESFALAHRLRRFALPHRRAGVLHVPCPMFHVKHGLRGHLTGRFRAKSAPRPCRRLLGATLLSFQAATASVSSSASSVASHSATNTASESDGTSCTIARVVPSAVSFIT